MLPCLVAVYIVNVNLFENGVIDLDNLYNVSQEIIVTAAEKFIGKKKTKRRKDKIPKEGKSADRQEK